VQWIKLKIFSHFYAYQKCQPIHFTGYNSSIKNKKKTKKQKNKNQKKIKKKSKKNQKN